MTEVLSQQISLGLGYTIT